MTQPFGTLVLSGTLTSTKTNTRLDGPCHQLVWAWRCPVGIPGEGCGGWRAGGEGWNCAGKGLTQDSVQVSQAQGSSRNSLGHGRDC